MNVDEHRTEVPCPTCGRPLGMPCDRAVHARSRRAHAREGGRADAVMAAMQQERLATVGLLAEILGVSYKSAWTGAQRLIQAGQLVARREGRVVWLEVA